MMNQKITFPFVKKQIDRGLRLGHSSPAKMAYYLNQQRVPCQYEHYWSGSAVKSLMVYIKDAEHREALLAPPASQLLT
ncbi:hypothetical protein A6E01_20455 (plasmid) [Vibrio breoganii]|uniref:Uncharacterized protein n=1 Tax=Vibrio breoganii TaxID=553239 RepID=A0AAN1CUJ8_9VIBR|nr:hypothetical protein [Vibrio breoganii]ANO35587.1 hypothetical protein A6E01_20455 [Vibrio breoganii]